MTGSVPTSLSDDVASQVEYTVEHFNANHADTVLFLAIFGAGQADATDAEIQGVDSEGVDLLVASGGVQNWARLKFDETVSTLAAVQGQLLGCLETARLAAPSDAAITSLEQERAARGQLRTFITSVTSIEDLSPNMSRIVLSTGLDQYQPLGGDEFVYLFVPRSSEDTTIGEGFTMAKYQAAEVGARPYGAYYTVRHFDQEDRSIEIWAVRHGATSGVGYWAASAASGTEVALWGPRRSFDPLPTAKVYLFVVDESGLAAVARILDDLPAGASAFVIAEVIDESHEIELPNHHSTSVQWLHRLEREAGEGTALLDAVKAVKFEMDGVVAFGAAESHQISAVRKYLRHDRSMAANQVFMTGYWRRQ